MSEQKKKFPCRKCGAFLTEGVVVCNQCGEMQTGISERKDIYYRGKTPWQIFVQKLKYGEVLPEKLRGNVIIYALLAWFIAPGFFVLMCNGNTLPFTIVSIPTAFVVIIKAFLEWKSKNNNPLTYWLLFLVFGTFSFAVYTFLMIVAFNLYPFFITQP